MKQWHLPVRRISGLAPFLWLVAAPGWAAVTFDCVVQPSRSVLVGSPVAGVLAEVAVGRGDKVGAGDLIARLEDRTERAAVAVQKARAADTTSLKAQAARLTFAETRMERATALLQRGAVTQEAFDEAQAELDASRAEYARLETERALARLEVLRLEAALSLRMIQSPIDGVVVSRLLDEGEYVGQDARVAEIVALDPLNIEAFLPIGYFDQMALGMPGAVQLRQPADYSVTGVTTVVDRVFDARSGTFGVRLEVENPDGVLPAGQRCQLVLDIEPIEDAGAGLSMRSGGE